VITRPPRYYQARRGSHKRPRPAEGLFSFGRPGFATTQTKRIMTEMRVAKRGL
jgi:hypothetical protein